MQWGCRFGLFQILEKNITSNTSKFCKSNIKNKINGKIKGHAETGATLKSKFEIK